MRMIQKRALAIFVLTCAFHVRADTAPIPTIGEGMLDCSLYRYADQLDSAIAAELEKITADAYRVEKLKSAVLGSEMKDITSQMYDRGMLRHVSGCAEPIVNVFAGKHRIQLQLSALQLAICNQLIASERLRKEGLIVQPFHTPTKEMRCGMSRNIIPGLLTLGPLTQAGRSLPGENVVTIIAQGPFAEPPQELSRPESPPDCPGQDGRYNRAIEDMITNEKYVSYDLPKDWRYANCVDILGGPSSMGMCTVADWNNYQMRLYDEFEVILDKAVSSRDPIRVYSAANWLIRLNDPLQVTILSFDYPGRDCDVIRNRIVTAWGMCMADEVWKILAKRVEGKIAKSETLGKASDEIIESVLPCFTELPKKYKDANELIADWLRPMPAPEKRRLVLAKVQQRIQKAMQEIGYGNCDYYGEAVMRMDAKVWRDHYQSGIEQLPIDWEHDFWKSAQRCSETPF